MNNLQYTESALLRFYSRVLNVFYKLFMYWKEILTSFLNYGTRYLHANCLLMKTVTVPLTQKCREQMNFMAL